MDILLCSNQDEARKQYVDLIGSLVAAEAPAGVAAQPAGSSVTFNTLLVSIQDGVTTIQLNRPEKKNAITVEVTAWHKAIYVYEYVCVCGCVHACVCMCATSYTALSVPLFRCIMSRSRPWNRQAKMILSSQSSQVKL